MSTDLTSRNLIEEEFERDIAKYVGTRYAILCSSGRTAIRLCLWALRIQHGDEVVVPDFADKVVPLAVFCNGVAPVFSDIDRKTLAISPKSLAEVVRKRTKAVIFIHPFGYAVDPSPILEITNRLGIAFIDDAAQAFGATVKGKKAGSFGNVGILTFNKAFNVDHGAAITTNDQDLASRIRQIRKKHETRWLFASFSYGVATSLGLKSEQIIRTIFWTDKYLHRLRDIMLAKRRFRGTYDWRKFIPHIIELWRSDKLTIDITDDLMAYVRSYSHRRKLEKAETLRLKHEFGSWERYLQSRRTIAKMYDEHLEEVGFSKIVVPEGYKPSYWRYPILFWDKDKLSICIRELSQAGFHIDGRYKPLHASPLFDWMEWKRPLKECVYVWQHILPLPVARAHPMNLEEARRVISTVKHCTRDP